MFQCIVSKVLRRVRRASKSSKFYCDQRVQIQQYIAHMHRSLYRYTVTKIPLRRYSNVWVHQPKMFLTEPNTTSILTKSISDTNPLKYLYLQRESLTNPPKHSGQSIIPFAPFINQLPRTLANHRAKRKLRSQRKTRSIFGETRGSVSSRGVAQRCSQSRLKRVMTETHSERDRERERGGRRNYKRAGSISASIKTE